MANKETIIKLMLIIDQLDYWEYILDEKLPDNMIDSEYIDDYVKTIYAEKLKTPEVMARILGEK